MAPKARAKAPTSILWSHFERDNDEHATCNICKMKVSHKTTISNLKKHYTRRHPMVSFVRDMEEVEGEVIPTTEMSTPSPCTSTYKSSVAHTLTDTQEVQGNTGPSQSTGTVVHTQSKISRFARRKLTASEKKAIDDALVSMIIYDFQPFSIVSDGFRAFVKALNPNYEIPNRKRISATMIPARYEETRMGLRNFLANVKTFCITTDCWTSCNNDSYIAVTGHFIYKDKFYSCLLTCQLLEGRHTITNLSKTLKDTLAEWEINQKVIFGVSDNAANIQGALKDMQLKHMGCAAHTLNLIVEKGLRVEEIQSVLTKVKKVVNHFHSSTLAWDKLQEFQKKEGICTPKKLINSCPTRWNSTLFMLQRFAMLEVPLKITVAHIDADLPILTSTDWQMVRDLSTILQPFHQMTQFLSKQKYPPASSLIVIVRGLIDLLRKFLADDQLASMKPVIKILLDEVTHKDRFGTLEWSKTLSICTFLDPRYKLDGFSNQNSAENAKKYVKELVMAKVPASQPISETPNVVREIGTNSQMSLFDCFLEKKSKSTFAVKTPVNRAIMEVQRYLEEGCAPLQSDPISWWYENRREFPLMSEVALERLCIVCTSVPCEQLFSKAGMIITERRSRLSPVKARMLVFLNANKNIPLIHQNQ